MARVRLLTKPRASFSLVDPAFDAAGRGDIVVFFADLVRHAQETCELPIVRTKSNQHVLGKDGFSVVVLQSLRFGDLANGMQRVSPKFAGSLGDITGSQRKFARPVRQGEMIIAEVATAHMPMEILRFQMGQTHRKEDGGDRWRFPRHRYEQDRP